ncbi:MAG: amidohydrolase family protein [Clostridiales bacterium]|nr:amidohydrolase family protein [Clostridiales bacterium]
MKALSRLFVLMLFFFFVAVIMAAEEKKEKEEPVTALLGGTLIDGNGGAPIANSAIIIQGSKIKEVGRADKIKIPEKAKKIDISGNLMAQKGVYNVPTLAVYRELYRANGVPAFLVEKRHWTLSMHETLFKKARERKITMGIGTDSVGQFMKLYPGIYFTEMKYFVELGASPMEAIVAATKNGALILGKIDELGTIEAGKLADIQVLKADPLKSFDNLGKPEIVITDGKIHLLQ